MENFLNMANGEIKIVLNSKGMIIYITSDYQKYTCSKFIQNDMMMFISRNYGSYINKDIFVPINLFGDENTILVLGNAQKSDYIFFDSEIENESNRNYSTEDYVKDRYALGKDEVISLAKEKMKGKSKVFRR